MLKRIPLDRVIPNPDQPRKLFCPKALDELAASIRENGLMQPITVRRNGDGATYLVVAGERRWRAHKILAERGEADTILCHVRAMDDDQLAIDAIVENLQRTGITPLEEARAFQAMLDRGMSVEALARKLGIGQTWRITYRTRLLRLDPAIQTLLDSESITVNTASEIAKLEPADQRRVVQRINRGQIRTDAEVSAAVGAILDRLSQADIFGDAGKPSEHDVETVGRMEAKVDAVARMISAGWTDGECVIARRVDPNRAAVLADKLAAIRKHLGQMEKELRQAAVQAEMALDAA